MPPISARANKPVPREGTQQQQQTPQASLGMAQPCLQGASGDVWRGVRGGVGDLT